MDAIMLRETISDTKKAKNSFASIWTYDYKSILGPSTHYNHYKLA